VELKPAEEAEGNKVKEDCCPGKPFISFSTQVSWQTLAGECGIVHKCSVGLSLKIYTELNSA